MGVEGEEGDYVTVCVRGDRYHLILGVDSGHSPDPLVVDPLRSLHDVHRGLQGHRRSFLSGFVHTLYPPIHTSHHRTYPYSKCTLNVIKDMRTRQTGVYRYNRKRHVDRQLYSPFFLHLLVTILLFSLVKVVGSRGH